ncbi:MAG: CHASE2 domain-containing protein [Aquisalinus sp.]|nr:CHASE2 domain-containing protein [Aquisalinus sp.]
MLKRLIKFFDNLSNKLAEYIGPFMRFLAYPTALLKKNVVLELLGAVCVYVLWSIVDPFGLEGSFDRTMAKALNGITSPLYGQRDRPGQEAITVVLITRQALKRTGSSFWPPTYDAQEEIIRRIAQHQPLAIFMDLYYKTPQPRAGHSPIVSDNSLHYASNMIGANQINRNGIRKFVDTLEEIRKNQNEGMSILDKPVHILIGPVKGPEEFPISESDFFEPLREFVSNPSFGFYYGGSASVGIEAMQDDYLIYPMVDSDNRPQAAFVLYKLLCDRVVSAATRNCSDFRLHGDAVQSLNVNWGLGASNRLLKTFNSETDKLSIGMSSSCRMSTTVGRWFTLFKIFFQKLIDGLSTENLIEEKQCAYHDYIEAEYLFDDVLSTEQLQTLFKGKIVLVGSDVEYLADYVETPLYGRLPGVMAHAMALDNLIENGSSAQRPAKQIHGAMDVADMLICIWLFLCVIGLLYLRHIFEHEARESQNMRHTAYFYVMTLTGLILLLGFLALRLPPLNLLEISLAASVIVAIVIKRDKELEEAQGEKSG